MQTLVPNTIPIRSAVIYFTFPPLTLLISVFFNTLVGIRLYQYYAFFLVASQTKIPGNRPDSFTSSFLFFLLTLSFSSFTFSSLFLFLGFPCFTSHQYSALVSSPVGLYTLLLHIQCPDSGSFPSLVLIAHLVPDTTLSGFDSPSSSLSLCYLASRSVVIKQCGSSCPGGNHFPTSDSDSRHIIAEYNLILLRSRPVIVEFIRG